MNKKHKLVMLPNKTGSLITGVLVDGYKLPVIYKYTDVRDDEEFQTFGTRQHLYILGDDKIKVGDWYIDDCDEIRQSVTDDDDYWSRRPDYKKIIATTQSLKRYSEPNINGVNTFNGMVTSIPQSFISKYVNEYSKENEIKEVLVEYVDNGYEVDMEGVGGEDIGWFPKIELKLNSDNTINIKKSKTSWTREEVIHECVRMILLERNYQDDNHGHFVDIENLNNFVETNL